MSESTTQPIDNPYVGPRTFTEAQGKVFFGREREARDLTARVVSERLLLFYAQSGAGKSSLINARLIPRLRDDEGFQVLPVGRVSGELPKGVDAVANIFTFNLMASLDQSRGEPARLVQLTLGEFLARLAGESKVDEDGKRTRRWVYKPELAVARPIPSTVKGGPRFVLVIDQFEEIITSHPGRWQEREEFFRQINQAMVDDPNLWVVLTLREDYVAALDPYIPLLADRLRARFYMERMGVSAALDAIREPSVLGGREFQKDAADQLLHNLRQVRVPGQQATASGQYVEPVQLQVVCYQLWENVKQRPAAPITKDDLREAGDVELALGAYYEQVLGAVLAMPELETSEEELRDWFSNRLITETGTRGFVLQTETHTGGLPNPVVHEIERRFLIRRETRAGGVWYELVHDTFVEPIRRTNEAWKLRQNPPEIDAFVVKPKVITRGADLAVTWRVRNADSYVLEPAGVKLEGSAGSLMLRQHDPLYPSETTTYRLVATRGTGLRTASSPQPVTVIDPAMEQDQFRERITQEGLTVLISGALDRQWLWGDAQAAAALAEAARREGHGGAGTHYLRLLNARLIARAEVNATARNATMSSGDPPSVPPTDLAVKLGYFSEDSTHWQFLRAVANLPAAVFITGSYHTFLEASLQGVGKKPSTQVCRWTDKMGNISEIGASETNQDPVPYEPLVFHLYGIDRDPFSLALTEEDYVAMLIRVREEREMTPLAVRYGLQRKVNIVLGFDTQGWEFKALYHGLITWNYQRRAGGVIQVELGEDKTAADIALVQASISKSRLDLYWGEPMSLLRWVGEIGR